MPPSADEFERLLPRLGLLRRAGGGPTDIRMGGLLHGPGTPTSDSLLLLGSTKEFMVQAKAVAAAGRRGSSSTPSTGDTSDGDPAGRTGGLAALPRRAGRSWRRSLRPAYANGGMVMPHDGHVSSQRGQAGADRRAAVITVNAPNGQVSRQTEMQITAAAARGARAADRHNN